VEQWQEQYGYVRGAGEKPLRPLNHAADLRRSSLRDRLLSLMVEEGIALATSGDDHLLTDETMEGDMDQHWTPPLPIPSDYIQVDDRIRKDLAMIGFEEFSNVTHDYQEDDQICAEIRNLQRQLQEQLAVNYYRKRKLSEIAKSKLPPQEFYSLLNDIDKQLEQVYLKRTVNCSRSLLITYYV
jgi:hypothetical protein